MSSEEKKQDAVRVANVPSFLHPQHVPDLARLGRNGDGGYLVARADVLKSDWLIALGINDDWSFERNFVNMNNVAIDAYDASVGVRVFWQRFWRRFTRGRKMDESAKPWSIATLWHAYQTGKQLPKDAEDHLMANHWWVTLREYLKFFRGKRRHHLKFVGDPAQEETISLLRSLDRAVGNDAREIFFKIDIEGSEYDILDQIIHFAHRTSGLTIEFHSCRERIDTIEDFVRRYPLRLIHTHINNYSKQDDDGIPFAIELTFSSEPAMGAAFVTPHAKDMPNTLDAPDYHIRFLPD